MKTFILFSDGTWSLCENPQDIEKVIKNHWWPFPLDQEGDPRRKVTMLSNVGIEIVRKGI